MLLLYTGFLLKCFWATSGQVLKVLPYEDNIGSFERDRMPFESVRRPRCPGTVSSRERQMALLSPMVVYGSLTLPLPSPPGIDPPHLLLLGTGKNENDMVIESLHYIYRYYASSIQETLVCGFRRMYLFWCCDVWRNASSWVGSWLLRESMQALKPNVW